MLLYNEGVINCQITVLMKVLRFFMKRDGHKGKNDDDSSRFQLVEDDDGIVDSLETTGLNLQHFRTSNKVIDLSEEGKFLFQQVQELQALKLII